MQCIWEACLWWIIKMDCSKIYKNIVLSVYALYLNYRKQHHHISGKPSLSVRRYFEGARGRAVGWDTALPVTRSLVWFPMVSLEFFIDIILPVALWPWGWLSLQQKWVPGIFPGWVKAADAWGWQPYHIHLPIVLKSGGLNLLEQTRPAQACNGIALPSLY